MVIWRDDTPGSPLTETGVAAVSAPMPAFWGVVRSLPKREAFAAERLRMDHGFEVFLPLVQTKRASQPLFSGYFSVALSIAIPLLASCAWSGPAIVQRAAPIMRSTASRP
jgi:hypothetical protein